ncbi:MAG: hypothetical protein K6E59_03660 [Bacilli bacterium]|nr:hypothetical protein [Bacilli bacterium]
MREEEEPQVDESLLTPEQKKELEKKPISWKWLVFWGVLIALMGVCLIFILVL